MDERKDRQLVVFTLAGETYGIDIAAVREIIRMQPITRVPNSPEFVVGVINLRSRIIPVLDLRRRFGIDASDPTAESRVVVVETLGDEVGLLVDGVREVLSIPGDTVEEAPALVSTANAAFVEGIANLGDRLLTLLDIHSVLAVSERGSAPGMVA